MVDQETLKTFRRKLLRNSLIVFLGALFAITLYQAKALIVPCLVGAILAYLLKPVVYQLRARGVPSKIAISSVAIVLIGILAIGGRLAWSAFPQGLERIESQVRAEHRLTEILNKSLRIEISENGQWDSHLWFYKSFQGEIDHLITNLMSKIRISKEDEDLLTKLYEAGSLPNSDVYYGYLKANKTRPQWQPDTSDSSLSYLSQGGPQRLSGLLGALSPWLLMPIVFFFLLGDEGRIQRFLIGLIPNQYFELSLTLMERVDRAIGRYLRGTLLECTLVGSVIGFGIWLFGASLQASILIGFLSGLTNAIPFLGTAVGLTLGAAYALVAQDIQPILPFLGSDDLLLGVGISVTVAHLLDNAYFQPILVGQAVDLHPLAVLLAVAAGGVGFGFIGVLIAIPTVVILKAVIETLYRGLQDYRLI